MSAVVRKMVVSEIFHSLQGEGRLAGVPSVFIRLAGCPLRCRWCDTKYAWDSQAGTEYDIDRIVQMATKPRCGHVVVTGGEPMVNKDLPQLVQKLEAAGRHITIETAGVAYIPQMPCDLMSISPKLGNSMPEDAELASLHEHSRPDPAVLRELVDNYDYQLKFVVDSSPDLFEVQQMLDAIGGVDQQRVMLMPQAATRQEFLAKAPMVADMCKLMGFTFSQRLQVLLWNNQRGR